MSVGQWNFCCSSSRPPPPHRLGANANRLALHAVTALDQAPSARAAVDEDAVEAGPNTRDAEGKVLAAVVDRELSRHSTKQDEWLTGGRFTVGSQIAVPL